MCMWDIIANLVLLEFHFKWKLIEGSKSFQLSYCMIVRKYLNYSICVLWTCSIGRIGQIIRLNMVYFLQED